MDQEDRVGAMTEQQKEVPQLVRRWRGGAEPEASEPAYWDEERGIALSLEQLRRYVEPLEEWEEAAESVETRGLRRRRRPHRRPRLQDRWREIVVDITIAWLLLYPLPAAYYLATGKRFLGALLDLLPSGLLPILFTVHSIAVLLAWGYPWWQRRAEERAYRQRLETARTIRQLLALTPSEFEEWTGLVFAKRGYRVTNMPDVGDHGIDLIVERKGERGVVQCKRYRGTVGEPVVRDLYGTMIHENMNRAYLATTGRISRQAHKWSRGKPIELLDGERLVRLAQDVGVKPTLSTFRFRR